MWTQTILPFSDKARTFSPCALVQGKNTVIVFSPQYLQADIWENQRQTKYWHENVSLPEICKVIFGIDMLDWPNICSTQNLDYFNSDVTPCLLNQHLEFIWFIWCPKRNLWEVYDLFLVTQINGEDALKLKCLLVPVATKLLSSYISWDVAGSVTVSEGQSVILWW